jgi:hypothetical protein
MRGKRPEGSPVPSKANIVVKRWVFREPTIPLPTRKPSAAQASLTIQTRERVVILTAGKELRCSCQTPDEISRGRECVHVRQVRRLLDVQDRFRTIEVEAGGTTATSFVAAQPPPKPAPKLDGQAARRKFRFKR